MVGEGRKKAGRLNTWFTRRAPAPAAVLKSNERTALTNAKHANHACTCSWRRVYVHLRRKGKKSISSLLATGVGVGSRQGSRQGSVVAVAGVVISSEVETRHLCYARNTQPTRDPFRPPSRCTSHSTHTPTRRHAAPRCCSSQCTVVALDALMCAVSSAASSCPQASNRAACCSHAPRTLVPACSMLLCAG